MVLSSSLLPPFFLFPITSYYLYIIAIYTLLLFSHSVMSDSLQPHGLQHSRPPCPSPSPRVAQVHVHCISDAVQPSHPLMPSSPSAISLSQTQELVQWVVCMHQITKILELQLQHQSFQWIFTVDLPEDWLVWSSCCPRDFHKSLNSKGFSPQVKFSKTSSLTCLLSTESRRTRSLKGVKHWLLETGQT